MSLLRTFQKYEKKIIFGLVIFTALAFGVTSQMLDLFDSKNRENLAGEIMGKTITLAQFQTRRNQCLIWTQCLMQHFNNNPLYLSFQPPFDMTDIELYTKKRDTYFDNLTWLVLMLDALADNAGVKVTPGEIRDYTKSLPIFGTKEEGFTYERYIWILSNWRVSELAFEEVVAEFIKINKYRGLVVGAITTNTKELYDEFMSKDEEIKIYYLAFNTDNYLDKTRVKSQEELQQYFQENVNRYVIPEKIQIEYIMANAEKMQPNLPKPPEESIQNYYNRNREKEYPTKSFIEAREDISTKLLSDIAKEQAIERITKVEEMITLLELQEKVIDFKDIARRFNLDYQMTGLIATENIGELEKELGASSFFQKQATTSMEEDISKSISTDKGHFIFRLLKKQGTYVPKWTAQVKEKVSRDFIKYKSGEAAKSAAHKVVQNITDKVNEELKDKSGAISTTTSTKIDDNLTYELRERWFETYTQEDIVGVKRSITGFFNIDSNLILLNPVGGEFKTSLFKKQKGEFDVLEDNNIYYVVQVLEKRVPEPSKFESEKEDIQKNVASKKRIEFVKNWLDDIKRQVKWESYLDKTALPR